MSIAEKLTTIAENEQKVFDAGRRQGDFEGYTRGLVDGYNDGAQAEYDAFWDAYQQNGKRTGYYNLFAWGGWNGKTFKPKYNMQPIDAGQMFYQFNRNEDGNDTVSLVELLNNAGVTLDFSKATSLSYCFQNAKVRHIGIVDLSSAKNVNAVFANTYWLNKIDKIIVNENNVFDTNCFLNCSASEIIFEGVLTSSIRLTYSTVLSKESIESVISTLSTATTGKTVTLNSTAVARAFGSTSSQEWLNLIATKSNWTITLS